MSRRPGEKRPLFVFVGIAALAALPQDPAQRVPRHDASATVKLVPVRVLDADGRPVRGLRKEDFALFDNGERKTITEFEAHVSARRLGGEAPPPGPAETTLPEVRRKYVFLLDMQASDLFGNRDAKRVVLEFIENELKPGDEASLMTFGGLTGLVLRQFLTSDLDKIKKAVERSVEMGGGGGGGGGMAVSGGTGGESLAAGGDEEDEAAIAARGEAQRAAVEGGSVEGQAGRPGTVLFKFRTPDDSPFGIRTGLRIEVPSGLPPGSARSKSDFDADLADLARAMKYMSGTKSLVFFSTRTPGKNVARLFAEAGATIYAVNTNSVPAKGGGAEAGGRREMKRRQGSALAEFAEATGGHYFSEVKEAAAIGREVEALSGNFYVLGYYITPAWDGGEHKIRVEVNKPGTRVLAQAAYNDPRPFAAMSAFEKDLHLFDLALAETPATADVLALPLRILTAETVEDANTAALFELAVDEKAGLPPGKTEIFTLIFDRDHAIVFGERGEVDTRPYAGKVLYPYFLAKLPPGEFECRVVARDLDTGQAASARRLVSVSAPIEVGIRLHPPLLFVPGREAEFVRLARPSKKGRAPVTIIHFLPFLPAGGAPLLDDLPPEVSKIWALIPLVTAAEAPPETRLEVKLIRGEDGGEVPVDWVLLDHRRAEPATDFLVVEIALGALGPGTYRVEFSVLDAGSSETTSAAAGFVRK